MQESNTYMDNDDMAHGDVVKCGLAQGQLSLKAEFHMCHIAFVDYFTCAKFVVLFENWSENQLVAHVKFCSWA